MTKREPFAKVVRKPNLHGIDAYLVACDGHPVEVDGDLVSAYIAAELMNDANEARVKEAVEKFKNEILFKVDCDFDDGMIDEKVIEYVERLITYVSNLPTEPEGK